MKVIKEIITMSELKQIAASTFGNLIKAVVDVDRGLIAIDAELHSDLEALLLEEGSKQRNLWGINLYPDLEGDEFIEFDSLINIRPSQGNSSRGIEKEDIRNNVIEIVARRIKK